MNDRNLVWDYVQSCASGVWGFADCAPVWQLGVICAFLAVAIGIFLSLVASRLGEEGELQAD
jgi:hypothetical protein